MNRIAATICCIALLAFAASAQKIYSSNSEYNADVKVYVVDAEYKADLVVYKTDKKYRVEPKKNNGVWYFTDRRYDSDKTIYFTDKEYRADLKVYFTDKEYRAGWRNKEKMHLLY